MGYVTAEAIAAAKQIDLLTYLQTYEPQELVKLSGGTYCTREHDSLKISNGKWHWFSRGIGGRTALDYLIKVKDFTFLQAVETLTGRAISAPSFSAAPKPVNERRLQLPELNESTAETERYLLRRGIHPDVIRFCKERKLLAESKNYRSAVFIGYDESGKARYAAIRGTVGTYKGEATGSDKHYSFRITEDPQPTEVHLFESAIDLLSYATLEILKGRDWKKLCLLSLAGVYRPKRENVVPVALQRYLARYPTVTDIHLHLDNDAVGRGAAEGITAGLGGRYRVFDELPEYGKDVNDTLRAKLELDRRKEEHER